MTNEQAINLAIEVLKEKDKELSGKPAKYTVKYIDAAMRLNTLKRFEIRESNILNRYFSKFDILYQMEKIDSVVNLSKKQREELLEDYKYINNKWR